MTKRQKRLRGRPGATARLSITIPAEDYEDIKVAADRKRVSVAWVVRDALRQYLREQAPLLRP